MTILADRFLWNFLFSVHAIEFVDLLLSFMIGNFKWMRVYVFLYVVVICLIQINYLNAYYDQSLGCIYISSSSGICSIALCPYIDDSLSNRGPHAPRQSYS